MHSIITVSGLSFEFSNGRQLFNNLSFSLESNVTALVGSNGVGKSSLAKLLTGELQPTEGTVRWHSSIVYFPQREMPKSLTVGEYLESGNFRSELGLKLLDGIERQRSCTQLSGGQWMRVRLALIPTDQYLILDEPTNDLDREGRIAVIKFLQNHPAGALLISHDERFVENCGVTTELVIGK
jgi:ATPase subunit of ABC transporter with duplicated ATPase domains